MSLNNNISLINLNSQFNPFYSSITIDSSGNVGVGKTDPSVNLDVSGNIKLSGVISGSGSSLISLNATNITSGVLAVNRGGTGGTTLTTGSLLVGNGTSTILQPTNLVWDNTNNRLGIGTTNPVYKCHIKTSYDVITSGLHLECSDTSDPNQYALTIYPYVLGGGQVGWRFRTQSLNGGINTPLTFTNNGNALLPGTISSGAITSSGIITATNFSGSGANLTLLNASNISSGTLTVIRGGTGAATLTSGQLLIGNGTSALLQSANLVWDNTNNRIGIGKTNPTTTLDVNGQITCTGTLNINTGSINGSGASGPFVIDPNYTTNSYVKIWNGLEIQGWANITGNVGIGKTNPSTALDVNGTVTATLFSGSGANLTLLNASNISSGTLTVTRGGTGSTSLTSGQLLIGNGTSALLQSANLVWDNTNNRIGLGITAPQASLDIVKETAVATTTDLLNMRLDGNWGLKLEQNYSTAGNVQYNFIHRYNTTNYNSLTFKGANVGIGTTNPQRPLNVQSAIRIGGTGAVLDFGDDLTTQIYRSGVLQEMRFSTNTTDRLRISSTGVVAIQDPTSSYALQYMTAGSLVIGNTTQNYGGGAASWNTNTAGLIMECADNTEIMIHDTSTSIHSFMYYTTTGNFQIGRNAGHGVANVSFSGNVSIRKTSASTALDVNGIITSTGLLCSGGAIVIDTSNNVNIDSGVLYVDANNNNVGIGTTQPNKKLHVTGDTRIEGNLTVNGTLTQINTNVGTTEQLLITNDGTGPALIVNQTGAQPIIEIQDDNVACFKIFDGGDLGIGTSTKVVSVDISGNLKVSGTVTGSGAGLTTLNASNINSGTLSVTQGGTGSITLAAGQLLVGNGTNTLLQSANLSWNNGTNTLSATNFAGSGANLTALTAANILGTLNVTQGGTGLATLEAGQLLIGNGTNTLIQSSNLVWDSANNRLGIGIANPLYPLDVVGNINFTGDLYKSGQLYISSQWTTSGSNIYYNTGSVSVGTTDESTYKLNIAGSVNATDYKINGVPLLLNLQQGMTVQTKHLTYTQMDVKNNTGWDAINDDLATGFVIAITPTSTTSKMLVNMIAHIGTDQASDSRWWGIKLYRKIGTGTWTEVTGANGTETGDATATAGTPVWVSNNLGSETANYQYFVANVTGTYLDAPNTTSIVYYTAYWNQRLGDNPSTAGNIFINRAASQGDTFRAATSSSWTATEIWDSGTTYTPPSTDGTITITSNSVAIGTTPNTTYKLNINQGTSSAITCFPLKISAGGLENFGNGTATLIGLATENSGWAKCAIGHCRTGTYDTGSIVFLCNNSNNNTNVTMANERMRISSAGNLGIGTTNPVYKCHIKTLDAASGLHLDASDTTDPNKYALTIYPYVIDSSQVGWMFRTQNNNGGTHIPLTFNNNGNITIAGTATATNFTGSHSGSGVSLTSLNASNISSGTLTVTNGGTGVTTLTATQLLIGNGTDALLQSANLVWDNSTNTLSATNISTDVLTVNGVSITSTQTAVQSDWDVIDDTSLAYIANKPAFVSSILDVVSLLNTGFTGGLKITSGYVGIGDIIPIYNLDIIDDVSTLRIKSNILSGNGNASLILDSKNTGESAIKLLSDGDDNWKLSSRSSSIYENNSVLVDNVNINTLHNRHYQKIILGNDGSNQQIYEVNFENNMKIDIIIVGGGGGGYNNIINNDTGGGGGGGAVLYAKDLLVSSGIYIFKVGRGGGPNENGFPSEAFGAISNGGQAGRKILNITSWYGGAGGIPNTTGALYTFTSYNGGNGGTGSNTTTDTTFPQHGVNGPQINIIDNYYWGGGGGGGGWYNDFGNGGQGGGGAGGFYNNTNYGPAIGGSGINNGDTNYGGISNNSVPGGNGGALTGGGGGGAYKNIGGSGGSGTIIIIFRTIEDYGLNIYNSISTPVLTLYQNGNLDVNGSIKCSDIIVNSIAITKESIQSNWNEIDVDSMAYIANKPTITPQVQSDWAETNNNSLAFIANKPVIPPNYDNNNLILDLATKAGNYLDWNAANNKFDVNLTTLNASNINSGILTVANGGIGATTLAANQILIGNGTNALLQSSNLSWNNTSNILTATNFVGSGTGLTALNASNISSGTLTVTNGGTGCTSLNTEFFDTSGGILSLKSLGSSQWTTLNNNIYFNTANVGIGITNLNYKLQVEDGILFVGDSIYLNNSSSNIANDYYLLFDNTYNGTIGSGIAANKIRLMNDISNNILAGFGMENNCVTYHSGSSGSHTFYSGTSSSNYGTGRFQIDQSGNMTCTGDIAAFTSISDQRLKTNIIKLDSSIDIIKKLNPVKFNWKYNNFIIENKQGTEDVGFIAQEIEQVIPLAAGEYKVINSEETYKNIKYERIIPYLVKSMQELLDKVYRLEQEIQYLKQS